MKKVALSLIMVLLISTMLAAGGGRQAQAGGGSRISVLVWTSAEVAATIKEVAKPFEDRTNAIVEVTVVPLADYIQRLTTMVAANSAPEVYWVGENMAAQFYNDGLLGDLSSLMSDREWDFDDFVKSQRDYHTYNGKLMAVPFSGQPLVLFYNKTLFQKAGLKTPTELFEANQWTVDAMLDAAVKLADSANGVFGIDFSRQGDWGNWDVPLTPVLRLYGGRGWSDDFRTVELNNPASLRGVEAFYNLLFTSRAHPMPGTQIDFRAGKLAMFAELFNTVRTFTNLDFEWDVVPMPLNQNKLSTGWSGSAGYTVDPRGKSIPLAVDFVRHITNKESFLKLMYIFVPTRMSALTSSDFKTGNNGQIMRPPAKSFDYCINNDVLAAIPVKQSHPKYVQISEIARVNLEAMYAGAGRPQETLDKIAREIQPLMSR